MGTTVGRTQAEGLRRPQESPTHPDFRGQTYSLGSGWTPEQDSGRLLRKTLLWSEAEEDPMGRAVQLRAGPSLPPPPGLPPKPH